MNSVAAPPIFAPAQNAPFTETNHVEAQYTARRRDGDAAWTAIANELRAAPIEFHPADRRLADLAADFKTRHRLSLAAAFAAALARERKTDLITGDPEFKPLQNEIKIEWLQ